jgi:lipopolysaccharide biosynthesis glycosyltransferase
MPSCCIVYTSDETYLFPTLVSAIQARRFAPADKADVAIFHFSISARAERDFAAVCAQLGILFLAVDPNTVEGASPMMARLLLNRFMPEQYSQYLYVDGDVHITRSLDQLIDAAVPAGRFLAANDPMTFMLTERGAQSRDFANHMESIGLGGGSADRYFNTGVLRINRAGWDEIGLEAWAIVRRNSRKFRFPDQDPLNIVSVERSMPMSLAWNFPIFMRNARVEGAIKPCIYHFMSSPKPWQGAFAPWGPAAHRPYLEMARRYPALAPYNRALPVKRWVRYQLQQAYKKIVETCSWGFGDRRDRILRYEARTMLAGHG